METYKLDLSPKDIGEMITIIRVQKFHLNLNAFAKKLQVSERQLELIEDGMGAHGISLLRKIAERYPKLLTINLEVKL